MHHLRLLPPIDDKHLSWFYPDETALFAADDIGFKDAVRYAMQYFNLDAISQSPSDIVLCTGPPDPEGTFTTIRCVRRPLDLLDEWAPTDSRAPDPSFRTLYKRFCVLKKKVLNNDYGENEDPDEIQWHLSKTREKMNQIREGFLSARAQQRAHWGDAYPSIIPSSLAPDDDE